MSKIWTQITTVYSNNFTGAMLKRALSRASRSRSWSQEDEVPKKKGTVQRDQRARPTNLSNPVMMMALEKVAKGHAATLVPAAARASVLECGAEHVSESHLTLASSALYLVFEKFPKQFSHHALHVFFRTYVCFIEICFDVGTIQAQDGQRH